MVDERADGGAFLEETERLYRDISQIFIKRKRLIVKQLVQNLHKFKPREAGEFHANMNCSISMSLSRLAIA